MLSEGMFIFGYVRSKNWANKGFNRKKINRRHLQELNTVENTMNTKINIGSCAAVYTKEETSYGCNS